MNGDKTRVTSIGASQQKTDFWGGKLTVNSKPLDSLSLTYGVDAEHETFNANQQFFDLNKAAASGGMKLDNAYNVGRYPDYSITNLAPFLQASYDIDAITLSGGVRYQYTENKVDDFVGYTQQQGIATGKATSADAVPGGKTDYNNLLFNAGILGHLSERQQLWFNFSQGFELPDLAKYYGSGTYRLENGHYRLLKSVNVNDSRLDGIKVDSYELGWRYTGDNLRTQLAAYYSVSDKTININKTDMTITLDDDKRRIYGLEGQVDYFFSDSAWSTGANFNAIKSETRVDGDWKKLTVDSASRLKSAPGLTGHRITGPCACRAPRHSMCLMMPVRKSTAITRWTLSAAMRSRSVKSRSVSKTCWIRITPPSGSARARIVQSDLWLTGSLYLQRPRSYVWPELFRSVLITATPHRPPERGLFYCRFLKMSRKNALAGRAHRSGY
ncbi:TonB-dependent receptor domain-containing protein [Cronobacter sakazakii]|uniref:TonB-dependent receptor domain-containing protein n=1 Tax=Cronobacter sakazakii TaxID=28141 RepID=UPI0030820ECC